MKLGAKFARERVPTISFPAVRDRPGRLAKRVGRTLIEALLCRARAPRSAPPGATASIKLSRPPSSARRGIFQLWVHDSELVNASAAVLGDIDIILGVHSDAVRLVELAGEASWPAEAR